MANDAAKRDDNKIPTLLAVDSVSAEVRQVRATADGALLVSSAGIAPTATTIKLQDGVTATNLLAVDSSGRITVLGPLTDTQLRAVPVPVSGPLTDAQLRAAVVPVSAATLPLPTGAATEATAASPFKRIKKHVEFIPSSTAPTTIYSGFAPNGTADATAAWTIQRLVFTGVTNIDETWTAVGTASWAGRATEVYS